MRFIRKLNLGLLLGHPILHMRKCSSSFYVCFSCISAITRYWKLPL